VEDMNMRRMEGRNIGRKDEYKKEVLGMPRMSACGKEGRNLRRKKGRKEGCQDDNWPRVVGVVLGAWSVVVEVWRWGKRKGRERELGICKKMF
jgi:hypothetical protein